MHASADIHIRSLGPSIKYVKLEVGRGSEKVWQFVTGRVGVQEHVTSHFSNFFIHMKP